MPVLFGGHNLPPALVVIGVIDLPKSGVAMACPAPPGITLLHLQGRRSAFDMGELSISYAVLVPSLIKIF